MTSDAIASQLAAGSVELGSSIRAKSVFAEGGGRDGTRYNVTANGELVIVRRVPEDLPFMEHPAYDDNPETLLRVRTESLRRHFASECVDLESAVSNFMKSSGCSRLRIELEDGSSLYANASNATVYQRVKRRFLPGYATRPIKGWAIA